jgi:hypothetical protein
MELLSAAMASGTPQMSDAILSGIISIYHISFQLIMEVLSGGYFCYFTNGIGFELCGEMFRLTTEDGLLPNSFDISSEAKEKLLWLSKKSTSIWSFPIVPRTAIEKFVFALLQELDHLKESM